MSAKEVVPMDESIWRQEGTSRIEGLTRGRVVHFVVPETQECPRTHPIISPTLEELQAFVPMFKKGEHCAAFIVGIVGDNRVGEGCVNLSVHYNAPGLAFYPCVPYSEDKEPGTWHWIERA